MAKTTCPVCEQSDQIQKISAIQNAGISTSSMSGPTGGLAYSGGKVGYVGGYSSLSGTTVSRIAGLLRPPTEPVKKGSGCLPRVLFWISMIILVYAFMFLVIPIMSGRFDNLSTLFGMILIAAAVFLLVVGHNEKKGGDKESREKYEKEKAQWDKAIAKYDRSYYCFRDDQVFDPQTKKHCAPQNLTEFLYK